MTEYGKLQQLWKDGVRIIQYPNGHRTEIVQLSSGTLWEHPLYTPEELIALEIDEIQRRISRDTERLRELLKKEKGECQH